MTASIQQALSDSSLSLERMQQLYSPFLSLTSRILGAEPHFLTLAHESPLTHVFYLASLRPCFHLPQCDLGALRIDPATRRAALLESSIVHQCPYCTGHVAAMGDVFKGPMVMQCTRRGDLAAATDPAHAVVKQFVAEVCSFPAAVTAESRARVVAEFGDDGYTQLAAMLSFMGFLNFTMGAAGMKLESRMVPFAEAATKNRKLPFSLRRAMKDDNEEALGDDEVANVRKRRGLFGVAAEHLRNAWGLLALIGPVAAAGLAEKKWFTGIPTGAPELDQWCQKSFKVELACLGNVTDAVLKRCVALGLRLVFLEDEPFWSLPQKCLFLRVLAEGIMDPVLKDDAMRLYQVNGGDYDVENVLAIASSSEPATTAFEAGVKFMHACAGYADNVSQEIVDDLMRLVQEHRPIVDLVGMVGHFGFWHRAAVLYPKN